MKTISTHTHTHTHSLIYIYIFDLLPLFFIVIQLRKVKPFIPYQTHVRYENTGGSKLQHFSKGKCYVGFFM